MEDEVDPIFPAVDNVTHEDDGSPDEVVDAPFEADAGAQKVNATAQEADSAASAVHRTMVTITVPPDRSIGAATPRSAIRCLTCENAVTEDDRVLLDLSGSLEAKTRKLFTSVRGGIT